MLTFIPMEINDQEKIVQRFEESLAKMDAEIDNIMESRNATEYLVALLKREISQTKLETN